MVGRPRRRRHAVTADGRLHETTPIAPSARHVIDERKGRKYQKTNWLRLFFMAIGTLVAVIALWVLVGSVIAYNKVTDKNTTKKAPSLNFLGEIKPNQLNGEGDGRVNILLIGVGGAKHPGGTLADTIIVASLDPKNKEVALLSIPRDLYVPISGDGYGKINSAHSYGEQNAKKTGGGPAVLKKTVSTILDLPIHYYVRVDFTALQKIVDTLGGVTVQVEKPIVDLSYPADNMIDYAPFRLNVGLQTLDGKTALKYARSRHGAGSEGSDFARARRQQKLLAAIREKALSLGVMTNPKKISDIIAILGDHVKTDLSGWEMERLLMIWKDTDMSKILTKVLDDGPGGPLISSSGDSRGYILEPRTGDFSEIQEIAHEIFTDPYLRSEKATIAFVNATGSTTTGSQVISLLKRYGYQVTDVTLKGQAKLTKTELIDHTKNKPYTKKFLESRFKVSGVSAASTGEDADYDLTLILGTDYKVPKVKNVKPSPKPSVSSGVLVSPAPTVSTETD